VPVFGQIHGFSLPRSPVSRLLPDPLRSR
jgi:hypothetical protein